MYHKRFMSYYKSMRIISRKWIPLFILVALFLSGGILFHTTKAKADCTPGGDFGVVTFDGDKKINITQPGTNNYRVWSRIQIPSTANSNYMLEVDGSCMIVGKNSITPNTWTWIDVQTNGNKSSMQLAQGLHKVRLLGTSEGVLLDKVMFVLDTGASTCVPDNTVASDGTVGNNCADESDGTPPSVLLTAPSAGTVSNTVNMAATASDDSGTVRVEFQVDGTTVFNDTSAPFSYDWSTKGTVANGNHTITAKAIDPTGNSKTSSSVTVNVQNGDPDLIVTAVTVSPSSLNVGDKATVTATIKNNSNFPTTSAQNVINFTANGTSFAQTTYTPALAANATATITASSQWTATAGTVAIAAVVDSTNKVTESNENNNSASISVAVSSPDTTAPSVSITSPANNATGLKSNVTITANATDPNGGSGMQKVAFYVDNVFQADVTSGSGAAHNFIWDTTKVTNTSHTIGVRAYDKAGNVSSLVTISVTVANTVPTQPVPGDTTKTGEAGYGIVNYTDLVIVLNNYNKGSGKTREQGNVDNTDGQGVVNYADLKMVLNNWTK